MALDSVCSKRRNNGFAAGKHTLSRARLLAREYLSSEAGKVWRGGWDESERIALKIHDVPGGDRSEESGKMLVSKGVVYSPAVFATNWETR